MKTNCSPVAALALALFSTLHPALSTCHAQGTAFTYQGRLDSGGTPAEGIYDLRFTIYDASGGGSVIAGPLTNAATAVSNGLFTVTLDFGAGVFTGADRWLDVGVRTNGGGAFTTLSPRQPLTATPYAMLAGTVSGTVPAAQISGTLPLAQLPPSVVTNGATGVTLHGLLSGDGAGLTNVPGTAPPYWVADTEFEAQPNRTYHLTNDALTTLILPASANVGDVVQVKGFGAGGWQVAGAFEWTPRLTNAAVSAVASSADGRRLAATVPNGQIFVSTDSGVTWTARETNRNWRALAMSPDGLKLVAAENGGRIYTSADGGITWTARDTNRMWQSVAMSADGAKLVAAVNTGELYRSTNSGVTWTLLPTGPGVYVNSVVSSADGNRLAGILADASMYSFTSSDGGNTWSAQLRGFPTPRAIASSADGLRLVTVHGSSLNGGGEISTSTDGGVTWRWHQYAQTIWGIRPIAEYWFSVATSADGSKIVAGPWWETFYFSLNGGATWRMLQIPIVLEHCALSADGSKLLAAAYGGQLYTTPLCFSGGPGTARQFVCVGNGLWRPLEWSSSLAGDGGGLTNLNPASLAGTLAPAQIPNLDASKITSGTLAPAQIPNLDASKITSGTLAPAQIPNLDASKITSGTLAPAQIPNLDASKITSGTLSDARLSANVTLRAGGNTFTGDQLLAGGRLGIGDAQPQYLLEGRAAQAVCRLTTTNHSNGAVLILRNTTASPTYIGAINFDTAAGTPGQIGYLANGQMSFRAGGVERMTLNAGGLTVNGTFVSSSDRNAKDNFEPVDAQEVLAKVAALPVSRWNYKSQDAAVRHIGPTAQDFRAAFGVGESDTGIATVDADGVALAAIQGLNEKVEVRSQNTESQIRKLAAENAALKAELDELKQLVRSLAGAVNGGGR